jgi:hypothetical protein
LRGGGLGGGFLAGLRRRGLLGDGSGEQVAAVGIEPEADRLAPAGPGAGENTGQPAVAGHVDGVLVPAAAERDVGDRPGQVALAVTAALGWSLRRATAGKV